MNTLCLSSTADLRLNMTMANFSRLRTETDSFIVCKSFTIIIKVGVQEWNNPVTVGNVKFGD